MQFTAAQIAQIINATVEGDPNVLISDVAKIEDGASHTISFIANNKYEPYVYTTQSGAVIVNHDLKLQHPVHSTLLRVTDAYAAFAHLLEHYNMLIAQKLNKKGIEQPSYIHETATMGIESYIGAFAYIGSHVTLGNNVKIYPHAYIGDGTQIGDNSIIYSGVKIYHQCIIGKDNIIHAGSVIGSDGFGFAPLEDGSYKKIPQMGNVVTEDAVEIGANVTIDRATMGTTLIKTGTKIDNLIQIAHNATIGAHTVIAAQTGISGSTKIGDYCMIGGQVGIVGHIKIADHTHINAQSGVTKTITQPHTVISGSPAFDYRSALKSQAIFKYLPELQLKIVKLEKALSNQL
jgi:UDP-3-O-[3-hydroxymyristoyl] glucosamine N-acyltransferase